MQSDMYTKLCKIYQQFKNRKTLYGHHPPKITAELKTWDSVPIELISPYRKSIKQQQTGGAIIKKDVILTFMAMINPDTS